MGVGRIGAIFAISSILLAAMPMFKFSNLSNDEAIVTVVRCNLCSSEDEAKTPVGTTITLSRVTD